MTDSNALVPYDPRLLPVLAEEGFAEHPIVVSLLRKTPKNIIQMREGRYAYVPWSYYARVLTETFGPFWTTEVVSINHQVVMRKGKEVTEIVARVRIVTPFGSQPGVGSMIFYAHSPDASWANAEKGAVSDALRNAASRLGIAADVKAEVEESPEAAEEREAERGWRTFLRELGLTEKAAVAELSEKMAGGPGRLTSLRACLDGTGLQGAEAYAALASALRETAVG